MISEQVYIFKMLNKEYFNKDKILKFKNLKIEKLECISLN